MILTVAQTTTSVTPGLAPGHTPSGIRVEAPETLLPARKHYTYRAGDAGNPGEENEQGGG